jgi:hypothetical protein
LASYTNVLTVCLIIIIGASKICITLFATAKADKYTSGECNLDKAALKSE